MAPESARVLVVEDEEVFRELVTRVLQAQDWEVDAVGDAEKALRAAASTEYDVVLSDKNLPGQSGLDLIQVIKEASPDVEVILMTAYVDTESVLRAINTGVYDYLIKPFQDIEDVTHTVRRALEKRRMVLENRRLIIELTDAKNRVESMNRDLEAKVAQRTELLKQMTLTDDVTGLYNQRFLYPRLEEEYQRAQRYERPFSILMLDVDCFKEVNDSHDHLFGSLVLRRLGGVLREAVRTVDLVIRYGGDEFVLLLPETPVSGATTTAKRVRTQVESADVGAPEDSYRVTVSVGIASYDATSHANGQDLLRAADQALYMAKDNGRNCVYLAKGSEYVRSDPP